jgi:hypothetical protein
MAIWLLALAACTPTQSTGGPTTPPNVTVRSSPATETPATAETPATTETPAATETPGSAQAPAGDAQIETATSVAQQWLALVDAGQYAESWSAAGKLFQSNMPQQQWVQTLTSARQPLGNVVSRELAGREIKTEIPGAPAGQYALVGYATDFAQRADLIETVTLIFEDGSQWKVVGYTATPKPAEGETPPQNPPGAGAP